MSESQEVQEKQLFILDCFTIEKWLAGSCLHSCL